LEKYHKGTQPKFDQDIDEQMNVQTIEKKERNYWKRNYKNEE